MSSPIRVHFMGTGSSAGTPVIGCDCAVCLSENPKNKRLRTSAWIQSAEVSLIIDTGPDFRQQCLRAGVARVDAVLYTHCHADHLNGIDDLRAFCYQQKQVIPFYAQADTIQDIQTRFAYTLLPPNGYWEKPVLSAHLLQIHDVLKIGDLEIIPIPVLHGKWMIYGYRIGDFAYLTDISALPASSKPLLAGVKVLALDSLRYEPHPTHFGLQQSLDCIADLGIPQAYLMHMTHEMEYDKLMASLPNGVSVAYDGLVLSL